MSFHDPFHDLTVYSPDERRVLIVEIEGGSDNSPFQLERVRHGLMSDTDYQSTPFFLHAKPNGLFLWRNGDGPGANAEFAPVEGILRYYTPSITPEMREYLGKFGMNMLVYSWVDDLVLGLRKPNHDSEADQLLVKAGIYDQIRGGRVFVEHRP